MASDSPPRPTWFLPKLFGYLGAIAVVSYFGLQWAGKSQQGNFLAFLGSVVMVIPPTRVLLNNAIFDRVAKVVTDDKVLRSIQVKVAEAQVTSYVRSSWVDVTSYFVGTLMLAAGFLIQVLQGNPST